MNCRDRALSYLNSRMRTSKEVEKYLTEKGYEKDEIRKTIEFLREYNYIDDSAYVRAFYAYGRRKKKAKYRIIKELETKGIQTSFSKEVIEAIDDGEMDTQDVSDKELALEAAISIVQKEFKAVQNESEIAQNESEIAQNESKAVDQRLMAKIGRRLSSLGYSSDTIYYVLGKIRDYEREE